MTGYKRNPLELPPEEANEEIRRQRGIDMSEGNESDEGRKVQISGTSHGTSRDENQQGEANGEE